MYFPSLFDKLYQFHLQHITSNDPLVHPQIDHNCLDKYGMFSESLVIRRTFNALSTRSPTLDLESFVCMAKFLDALTHQEPLNSIIVHAPSRTDEQIMQYVSYDTRMPYILMPFLC